MFDLDETLVHHLKQKDKADVLIDITLSKSRAVVKTGFNIRPYARECLEEANKYFEVGVFTASSRCYADPVIDYIDPEKKLIQHRLYRDSCVELSDRFYVKDLRVLQNRPLDKTIIIDNAVYSFAFHLDNGIPIVPFFDNKEDVEFLHLMRYFKVLANTKDWRIANRKAFNLSRLMKYDIDSFLKYYVDDEEEQKEEEEEELTIDSFA